MSGPHPGCPGGVGPHGRDRGAASVVAIGLIAAVVLLTTLVLGVTTTYVDARRAAAVADAAALAAADAVTGVIAGLPCEVADRVARRNGATLRSCEVDGAVSRVVIAVPARIPGLDAEASARAGPPGSP
ncbi:Rv3654c family TadE-like protein [Agromyces sp. PvR057]|uniref:Rv3654c family TadE-like protein n=1 Tax=Agromyces sp. PvR057 TaxID=3156403 RepID=UPI000E2231A5